MKEEWKVIPESDNHAISNYGRMKKISTGRILTPQLVKRRNRNDCESLVYVIHNKSIKNKKHLLRRAVSICVMRAFRPDEYIEGKPIYRIDGDINNNRVGNFRYEDKNALAALKKREKFFNSLANSNEWDISGDIGDVRNKVEITHNVCGNKYIEKVGTIYRNRKPYCLHCNAVRHNNARRVSMGNSLFKDSLGRFSIAGVLGKMDEPVEIKDNKYDRVFTASKAQNFLRKNSTYKSPYDTNSQSSGESMIEYMLMKEGMSYFWQYYFNDCRNIKPLPFDFAIVEGNTPIYMIEYQGGQHYKDTEYFSHTLDEQVHMDSIKESYCNDHSIPLLILSGNNYADMYEKIKNYNHKYTRGRVR